MFEAMMAFLAVITTTVGVMTFIEGIGEKDYKKALLGGISAFAGYSALQSSIASSSIASKAAEQAASKTATSAVTDVASTGTVMEPSVLSDLQSAGTTAAPKITAATFSESVNNAAPSVFDTANQMTPTANIAGYSPGTSTAPTQSLTKTAPMKDAVQSIAKEQAITGDTGANKTSLVNKVGSFFGDIKDELSSLSPKDRNSIAMLIGKGMEYSAARDQVALMKEQNNMSRQVWNGQNSPVSYRL